MIRNIIGATVGTTMNPKKIAGNAEHSHSWTELTDKPFYEEGGIEITWDGNTDGLEIVSFYDDEGNELDTFIASVYKVSDLTPTKDEIKGSVLEIAQYENGEKGESLTLSSENATDEYESIDGVYERSNGKVVTLGMYMMVAYEDNAVLSIPEAGFSISLPKAGTYFYRENQSENYGFVSKVTIPGSIKQLDMKFIPNTIATKEYVDQLLGTSVEEIASLVGGDA